MSKENVKALYEALASDESLLEEFKTVIGGIDNEDKLSKKLPEFAKKHGYEFSIEDFRAAQQTCISELSPEELDRINAGLAYCWLLGFGVTKSSPGDTIHCLGKGKGSWCKYIGVGLGGSRR